ncbi:histidine phosphatase family protein [Mycolicibacterium sp. CH28]|uniref:histidine phosphatase family protein n=1 Tax=Mycolicibacterium sp. CH28 TaxID=2512237 RepID=UPI00108173BB|nr:histidine phosphatase family protein [Mycolicibacterium sp. CH28]TGD87342.1 histidine phosphatase family protein [Mycolicibacterium sp. CH28]
MRDHRSGILKAFGTVVAVVALVLMSALPAWAADSITLTWVRHGESYGNVAGAGIDTKVPGPGLTAVGEQQAAAVAQQLEAGGYDSIYVSDMIRTHQTAAPLATALGLTPIQEGGFREISAGVFEGSPVDSGLGRIGYFLIPVAWTLGMRSLPIPLGENGNEFEARVNESIASVIANGATKPVIFSHGATIMVWTMMNVDNPDVALLLTHPLGNTAVVVVTGNPEDGWTLQSWDGIAVSQNPSLGTQLFVNARNLMVAPQTALYNVVQAIKSGDLTQVVAAVRDGVVSVSTAGVTFVKNTVTDIAQAIIGALPSPPSAAVPPAATKVKSPAATAVPTQSSDVTELSDTTGTTVRSNGATDLTDGNKVEPGKAASGANRRGGALQAVSDPSGTAAATAGAAAGDGARKGTGSSARAHKTAA